MARDYNSNVDSVRSPESSMGEHDAHEHRRVLSAGTLAGDGVRNTAGDDLGKIEEIMIDIPSGRVAYAVLSFGGFMGIGNKLFAVPWKSLTLDEDRHEFVLDVDKATLENAPGFDKDNWPDMADPQWGQQIHTHYNQQPYWNEGQDVIGRRDADLETGRTMDRKTTRGKTLTGGGTA